MDNFKNEPHKKIGFSEDAEIIYKWFRGNLLHRENGPALVQPYIGKRFLRDGIPCDPDGGFFSLEIDEFTVKNLEN